MQNNHLSEFGREINFFGEFTNKDKENDFLLYQWRERKSYYLISYFTCTFLFFFHGFFDFKREMIFGSPEILMSIRGLFLIICSYFVFKLKKLEFPKFLYEFCFGMQLMSILVIFLLTIFTGGTSPTLPIGVMIMYASFYIMLPGRPLYALLSSILITCVYLFFSDQTKDNFFIFSFIILSSNIILWVFCRNQNRYQRIEFLSFQNVQELVEMKTKLLNVLAHDIRTPLQIILMRSSSGKNQIKKQAYDKLEQHFNSISENTNKIEGLVKDLLNWTLSNRPEESKQIRQSKDFTQTIKTAVSYIEEAAHIKHISIDVEIDQIDFLHDPIMMETVFRNLLSNSIKFSPESSQVKISSQKEDNKTIIVITDRGGPLTLNQIENIKNGTSVSTSGTHGEKGFGVGLRLVKSFLNHHKIKMEIETYEYNNLFILTLPS